MPAILASMLIVFALSIDDFVVTQYMSSSGDTTTIPMLLYSNARGGATTPALNAVATIMVRHDADRGRRRLPRPALVRPPHRVGLARLGDARADGGGTTDGDWEEEAIAIGASGEQGGEVALRGLTKRFDDVTAVDGIDLEIAAGEFFSLLGPVGLRQDDDAAADRRLRAADLGRGPARRRRPLGGAARAPQRQHRLPELRALPAPRRVSDNVAFGLRYQKVARGRARPARAGGARAGRARRARQAPPAPALRRPAAARRAGPGPGPAPGAAAPRRAARRARRENPPPAAARAEVAAGGGRDDLHLRHPRPGGGAQHERPDRGHAPTAGSTRSGPRARSTRARRPCSSPTSSGSRTRWTVEVLDGAGAGCRVRVGEFVLEAGCGDLDARGEVTVVVRPERLEVRDSDADVEAELRPRDGRPHGLRRLQPPGHGPARDRRPAAGLGPQRRRRASTSTSQGSPVSVHIPPDALRVLRADGDLDADRA